MKDCRAPAQQLQLQAAALRRHVCCFGVCGWVGVNKEVLCGWDSVPSRVAAWCARAGGSHSCCAEGGLVRTAAVSSTREGPCCPGTVQDPWGDTGPLGTNRPSQHGLLGGVSVWHCCSVTSTLWIHCCLDPQGALFKPLANQPRFFVKLGSMDICVLQH